MTTGTIVEATLFVPLITRQYALYTFYLTSFLLSFACGVCVHIHVCMCEVWCVPLHMFLWTYVQVCVAAGG